MADLDNIQSSGSTIIVGSNSSGLETNTVNATPNGDLNVNDGLKAGGVYGNLNLVTTATTYEAKVGASRLVNRKSLIITAMDGDIYWGYSNAVSSSNGTPLVKGQTIIFDIDANASSFQVWLVATLNNKNARIAESL